MSALEQAKCRQWIGSTMLSLVTTGILLLCVVWLSVRLHLLEQEVSYMLADLLDSQMEIAETLHEKQFSSYMRGEDVL